MTWPTALPAAALRVLRTAVGRRALQLGLLVVGLFALGFLCGEQAQAAEGVATPASVTDQVSSLTSSPASASASDASSASVPKAHAPQVLLTPQVVRSVRSVGGTVVRPVGDVVSAVSEQLGRASAQMPVASDLPDLPGVPDLPAASDLPSLPGASTLPSLPARTLPAPVAQAPGQGSAVTPTPTPGGHGSGDHEHDQDATDASRVTASYGPTGSVAGGSTETGDFGDGVARARTGYAPVPAHHGPAGDPNGLLGSASVLDGGSSRHADAHAVTPYHRVPLLLASGNVVRSDAAETRDRYRDIPVFPG